MSRRRENTIAAINERLRREKSPLVVALYNVSRPVIDTTYYEVAFREHPHLQKTTPVLSQAFLLLIEEEAAKLGFNVEWNNLNTLFWMNEDSGATCAKCGGGKDDLDDYDNQLLCSYCRMRAQDAERTK